MTYVNLAIVLAFFATVSFLRGGRLHGFLVCEAEAILKDAGFETCQEKAESLPNGGTNFVDLVARRGNCLIYIEAETSSRNVVSNAKKAQQLGRPLVIVVPTVKVKDAVQKRLARHNLAPGGRPICFLLLRQLQQEVTNCFSIFSPANGEGKNKKNKSDAFPNGAKHTEGRV